MDDLLHILSTHGVNMTGKKSEGGIFRFDQHLENNIFQYIHHSTTRDSFFIYLIKQKKIVFRKQDKQLTSFFWGMLNYLKTEEQHQAHFYWIILLNNLSRYVILRVYKQLEEIFFRSGLKKKLKDFFLAERAEVQIKSILGLNENEKDLWTSQVEGRLVSIAFIRQFVLQVEARRHLKKKGNKRLKLFRKKKNDVRLAYKGDRLERNNNPLSVELSLLRVGQFAKKMEEEGEYNNNNVTDNVNVNDNEYNEEGINEIAFDETYNFSERESKGERAFGGEERIKENPGVFGANTFKGPFDQEFMEMALGDAVPMEPVSTRKGRHKEKRSNLKEIYEQIENQKKPTRRAFEVKKKKKKILTCFRFDFRPTPKEKPNEVLLQKHTAKELIAMNILNVDTSKTNTKLIRKKSPKPNSIPKDYFKRASDMLPGKAQYLKNKQKRMIEMTLEGTDAQRQFLRKTKMSKKKERGDFSIDYVVDKRFNEEEERGKSPVKRRFSPVNHGVYRNHLRILKNIRKDYDRRRFD
jgi:hypothetical protein